MSPELEELRQQIFASALELDAELPDSPIARLLTYRTRWLFMGDGIDESTGHFTADGAHEIQLIMAVMVEQIALLNEE